MQSMSEKEKEEAMTNEIVTQRHDFVLLFDVKNGNPNGDPDQGNVPRTDPETQHGLVTDVCLKRKIRDYVTLLKTDMTTGEPEPGYRIYIRHRGVLEQFHREAYEAEGLKLDEKSKDKKLDNMEKARAWMCQTFFDIRTFGAVLTLDINCGQVRGPVQLTFASSIDPISPMEQTIVRKAVATQREADSQVEKHSQVTGTMGNKQIVPYGLYRTHGFVSPPLAADTGFTGKDLEVLWQSLTNMFEQDHSASRGEMSTRKLVVFQHESHLGNAPSRTLFERVKVKRINEKQPARQFSDYQVTVEHEGLPPGVALNEIL
jgi:CRISPR-associated protein Csd2